MVRVGSRPSASEPDTSGCIGCMKLLAARAGASTFEIGGMDSAR